MHRKPIDRFEHLVGAWELFNVTLEVVDFALKGEIRNALLRAIHNLQQTNYQPPKPKTIKVESERGPFR